jgi:hypothetical protein
MEQGTAAEILLLGMGFSGEINWQNEFHTIWPSLAEIFKEEMK